MQLETLNSDLNSVIEVISQSAAKQKGEHPYPDIKMHFLSTVHLLVAIISLSHMHDLLCLLDIVMKKNIADNSSLLIVYFIVSVYANHATDCYFCTEQGPRS